MSEATKQPTCEERIGEHLNGRLSDFRDLVAVATGNLRAETGNRADDPVNRLYDAGEIDSTLTNTDEELQEQAQERIWEMPLAVTKQTMFRIDLSTGGPADYLEVTCDTDEPAIQTIRYHFADWFDHAERTLEGDEFKAAAEFAENLIPELQ
jgi:hypothetical protein